MIAISGVFSEEMARFYFRQLIISLEYLHNQGYAHRDLKPENLLFGKNYNLKLADFGFAKALGEDKLSTHLGTESYMAPEILLKMDYSGTSVDLFAAGIVLFIMYSGTPAFTTALTSD